MVVVGGGGAFGPDEITAGVSNEEERLWRGSKEEGDEVLAGTGGGTGDNGGVEVVVVVEE